MRRGTTPTLQISCDLDLEHCKVVWLTLKQMKVEITKQLTDMTLTEDGFSVTLSQEETLKLAAGGKLQIQLRALTQDGVAVASNVETVLVDAILKDGEIK